MILSVSRRTDIPNYYADWFLNRIKEGWLYVRNPMNPHQVSRIELSPEVVDCIVFWTKNPAQMLKRLDELAAYKYYFQFTLTSYGKDVEVNVPNKKEIVIPTFQKLSEKIGKEKVIWRYDPILFTDTYTEKYHIHAFAQIAGALCGYTDKCVISFVDMYAKIKKNMEALHLQEKSKEELTNFAKQLADIAHKNKIQLATCAEKIDLAECGIEHNCCIDKALIEKIMGCKLEVAKDKNQRNECGCVESVEVGTYNTCRNGCKYCYANYSEERVQKSCESYNPDSPLLCGQLTVEDKVTSRKVNSLKRQQLSLFDEY